MYFIREGLEKKGWIGMRGINASLKSYYRICLSATTSDVYLPSEILMDLFYIRQSLCKIEIQAITPTIAR